MTLIQFLSYGLKHGQKVNLTLASRNSIKVITCYFKGFTTYCERKTAYSEDELEPKFYKQTASGKMSRQYTDEYTSLESIVSINTDPKIEQFRSLEDCRSLKIAADILYDKAMIQTNRTLIDLDCLFPGKKIVLRENNLSCLNFIEDGYTGAIISLQCRIKAVRWDSENYDELVLDLMDEYGQIRKNIIESEVDFIDYPSLLVELLDSIANPVSDENNFFNPAKQHFNDLPKINEKEYPALVASETYDKLYCDTWFNDLTEQQKMNHFEPMITNLDQKESGSLLNRINSFWHELPLRHKKLFIENEN